MSHENCLDRSFLVFLGQTQRCGHARTHNGRSLHLRADHQHRPSWNRLGGIHPQSAVQPFDSGCALLRQISHPGPRRLAGTGRHRCRLCPIHRRLRLVETRAGHQLADSSQRCRPKSRIWSSGQRDPIHYRNSPHKAERGVLRQAAINPGAPESMVGCTDRAGSHRSLGNRKHPARQCRLQPPKCCI